MTASPPPDNSLLQRVYKILGEWGKIGLLVDDAQDADNRVAAEVYGTDTLPAWWIMCKTVTQGSECVRALVQGIEAEVAHRQSLGSGYFVVVVDRYLPVDNPITRPEDWRERAARSAPSDPCKQFYDDLVKLHGLIDWGHVIPVTSFPRDELEAKPDSLPPFRARTVNPVDDKLRHSELFRYYLSRFGPVAPQDATWTRTAESGGKAAANAWWSSIQKVADALDEGHHLVVLVTGAGMSMWGRPGSAGIPWTSELVTFAAWWALREVTGEPIPRPVLRRPHETHREGEPLYQTRDYSPPKGAKHGQLLASFGKEAEQRAPKLTGLPQILGHFWNKGFTYAPAEFNKLFDGDWPKSPHLTPANIEEFRQAFEQGLRLATTLHDQGMTRQHRVAALLPFDLIITTNFDGLHERAALAVASSTGGRGEAFKILARGIPWEPVPENRRGRSSIRGRLVRVYGSVWHGEALAFERDSFEERQTRVLQAIEEVMAEASSASHRSLSLTLVVVGHRLYEDFLPQTLKQICCHQEWASGSIVLVDPDLGWTKDPGIASRRELLEWTREGAKRQLCLASGRALDFFYDLRLVRPR